MAELQAENARLLQQQNLGPDALAQVRLASGQLDTAASEAIAALK